MPIKFLSQLVAPKIGTENGQTVNGLNYKPSFHATQPRTDVFGQYDRALEQGHNGARYENGVIIGDVLNIKA